MTSDQIVNNGDFIEIKYTGYANDQAFDSNIEEDLKKLDPKAKPEKTIIVLGQGMLVSGLDSQLEKKEIDKEYEIEISAKDGFGERKRNLIRTIPLSSFTQQKVNPSPGMVLTLNNALVKIIAVSGARVTADFNHPLAGKELKYKVKIVKEITDDKEKTESLLKFFFRFAPDFELNENKVFVKLPKELEPMVQFYKEKFKELIKKDLEFEEKKQEESKVKPENNEP